MDPAEGRNKFCRECKKVVHNITGMAPDAIFNLLQSDPGNICVNFVESRLPKDTETKFPKAKPILAYRLHAAAATAAFLLMLQQAQAAPLVKAGIEWTLYSNPIPRELGGNTLITGTVVDRNGNLAPEEMEVKENAEKCPRTGQLEGKSSL